MLNWLMEERIHKTCEKGILNVFLLKLVLFEGRVTTRVCCNTHFFFCEERKVLVIKKNQAKIVHKDKGVKVKPLMRTNTIV